MTKSGTCNKYDLEERTLHFARDVAYYCKHLPKINSNVEYSKQLIRSSASIGANYIEANESLSKKDFAMRLKISRKEAKETAYWLRLIVETNPDNSKDAGKALLNESAELRRIFSAIISKL